MLAPLPRLPYEGAGECGRLGVRGALAVRAGSRVSGRAADEGGGRLDEPPRRLERLVVALVVLDQPRGAEEAERVDEQPKQRAVLPAGQLYARRGVA